VIRIGGEDHARMTVSGATRAGNRLRAPGTEPVRESRRRRQRLHRAREAYWRAAEAGGQRADARPRDAAAGAARRRFHARKTLVDNLSIAQRQMVEIAKALSIDARVIIMDEPTSSLTISETERLLEVIADLKAHGISVIYISHRLGEIMTCADRVLVLRDGRTVGELARNELSHATMIRLMIGRDLKALYTPPKRPAQPGGCDIAGLVTSAFPDRQINLSVRRGEILGLAGLWAPAALRLPARPSASIRCWVARSGSTLSRPLSHRRGRRSGKESIWGRRTARNPGWCWSCRSGENVTLASLLNHARMWLVNGAAERNVAKRTGQEPVHQGAEHRYGGRDALRRQPAEKWCSASGFPCSRA